MLDVCIVCFASKDEIAEVTESKNVWCSSLVGGNACFVAGQPTSSYGRGNTDIKAENRGIALFRKIKNKMATVPLKAT